MKDSRLRTIAFLLWGAIFALCALLSLSAFVNRNAFHSFFPPALSQTEISQLPPTLSPTISVTASPARVYLPSATLRAATAISETGTPTPGFVVSSLLTPPLNFDPLTGLDVAQPDILNRRPIAVKVSNFPRGIVRPYQSGLTMADLFYEYYIEDGLSRFIAVYYSQDASRAGPVRSGRYFDEYIMRMYHSALVFANADERVEKHLMESDLLPLLFLPRDDNCPPLCRDTSIPGYNNVFVNTAGVGPMLSNNTRQPLRVSVFGALVNPLILPAIDRIYTHYSIYSYNYWQFNPLSQKYLRFSDAADAATFTQGETYAPLIDHLNGKQVEADNIVVLVVPHIFHNEFDRADQVFDISLVGSGTAYVFRDGRMQSALWVRDAVDQPFQLQDQNGNFVRLKAGTTCYEVINLESSLLQNENSVDFFFSIPPRKVTPTPTLFVWDPTPTPRKHKQN